MCKNPQPFYLPEEQREILIGCRKCWQCRENRVNDLVGRALAEEETATKTYAVTLTYGGGYENPHAADLVYSDVQKFFKRIRKAKYNIRYMVAGEYGSARGRAHWHLILFFYGKTPKVVAAGDDREPWDIVLPRWDNDPEARINWAPWEHGFAYFQEPDYGAFQYALKYALKDLNNDSSKQNYCCYSKKPPLGHEYFQRRAAQYVEQGLVPQDWNYSFLDVKTSKGKIREFYLQGKSRDNFLETYCRLWEEKYGEEPPVSEIMEKFLGMDGRPDFYLPPVNKGPTGHGLFKTPPQYPIEDRRIYGSLLGVRCSINQSPNGDIWLRNLEGGEIWRVEEQEHDQFVRRHFKPDNRGVQLVKRDAS